MSEQEQKQPLTTAQIVQRMVEIRDERRKIGAVDKELIDEYKPLELELIIRLDEQGMEKASTSHGTASITETVLPQVVDWDAFYEWIKENDAFYMLQKRPAAAAYRELQDSGEEVAGLVPYTQRSIGLRKK
jgi:hypothetical protein